MTSLLLLSVLAAPRVLHVSPSGDDTNVGSAAHPWRSLARVSREPLVPGDEIVLASGATFDGSLALSSGGTPKRPVIVRTDGGGATILSTGAPAITVRTGGVEIRDLILKGGQTAKKEGHDGLLLAAPAGRRSPHVRVQRVEISGFGAAGISMTGAEGSRFGFENVRISHAKVHGNYGTGIVTADTVAFNSKGKVIAHKDLRITDCDVSDNLGGNGIIISGVDGALVEFCRAANNRSAGQALGMWAWCARRVVFRHCIASGTRGEGDAGGYDLDGGSVECVVEKSLSYDNDGPAAMHCDFPDAPRTHHNVIRDNVSVDDGRKAVKPEPWGFGFVVWGTGLYDCTIERNLAVLTQPDPKNLEQAGLFATFIRMEGKVPLEAQRLERALFRDNVVEIAGTATGAAFVRNNFPSHVPRDVTFRGNDYRSPLAPPFLTEPGGAKRYATLAEWRSAPGVIGDGPSRRKGAAALGDFRQLAPRDLPAFFRRLGR